MAANLQPAGGRQARERLTRLLSEDALNPYSLVGDLPGPAIAPADCDYDGASQGCYLPFESRSDQKAFCAEPRRGSTQIRGTTYSGPYWRRGRNRRTEGRLAFVRLIGGRDVLIWADDSRRRRGDIRASSSPAREMCTIQETRR